MLEGLLSPYWASTTLGPSLVSPSVGLSGSFSLKLQTNLAGEPTLLRFAFVFMSPVVSLGQVCCVGFPSPLPEVPPLDFYCGDGSSAFDDVGPAASQ